MIIMVIVLYNTVLDPSCNKLVYCDLIGQKQVSIFPYKPVKISYKLVNHHIINQ